MKDTANWEYSDVSARRIIKSKILQMGNRNLQLTFLTEYKVWSSQILRFLISLGLTGDYCSQDMVKLLQGSGVLMPRNLN